MSYANSQSSTGDVSSYEPASLFFANNEHTFDLELVYLLEIFISTLPRATLDRMASFSVPFSCNKFSTLSSDLGNIVPWVKVSPFDYLKLSWVYNLFRLNN